MPVPHDSIVKIWFSVPGEHPLGHHINVCRLRKQRRLFPNDRITLISNCHQFPEPQKTSLQAVCQELSIELIDLTQIRAEMEARTDLEDKKLQLELLSFAEAEVKYEFFVSASDIVRTLSVVLARGLYSDLDDVKQTRSSCLPTDNPLGLVLDVGLKYDNGWKVDDACNTPMFSDESKNSVFKYYRNAVYQNYTDVERIKMIFASLQVLETLTMDTKRIINTALDITVDRKKGHKLKSAPLIFLKRALKHNLERLNPVEYAKLHHALVIASTGPYVLQGAVQYFLHVDLKKRYGQLKLKEQFELLQSVCLLNHAEYKTEHENDVAWVKKVNDTDDNFTEYYLKPAARTIESAYLNYRKRNTVNRSLEQSTGSKLGLC